MSFLLFFLIFTVTEVTYSAVDFLICGQPDKLVVFDKYEQKITEPQQFPPPFSPMQILVHDEYLSDGFTRVMRISVFSQVYFILKDNSATVHSEKSADFFKRYTGVTIPGDTIEVINPDLMKFKMADESEVTSTQKNTLFRRIFFKDNRYYLQNLTTGEFVWTNLTPASVWQKFHKQKKHDTVMPSELAGRIDEKMQSYNSTLQRLFLHFNTKSNQTLTAPYWDKIIHPNQVTYIFHSEFAKEKFIRSSAYLLNELQTVLLGSMFQAIQENDSLIIMRKTN